MYGRIHKEVKIAQADLLDPETAPSEINRVLAACQRELRPVYIQLPTDIVTQPVAARLLNTPIDVLASASDQEAEDAATETILQHLYEAQRPVFLIDGGVQRRGVRVIRLSMSSSTLTIHLDPSAGSGIGTQSRHSSLRPPNG